jgi:acyl carrier protein
MSTSEDQILSKVRSIVAEQLCVEEASINPKSNFSTELGADSLDVVELVMALEEGFDINIPDESATDISTVADAVTFIKAELEKK